LNLPFSKKIFWVCYLEEKAEIEKEKIKALLAEMRRRR